MNNHKKERPSEHELTPCVISHPSKVHVEPQSDPSPRPSPTTHIPDSIPESSGRNHGGQSSSDKSLSENEDDMTLQSVYDLCISLCTQQRLAGKKSLKTQWMQKESDKKFKQLARDEEMARKVQEDWEAEEEVKKLAGEEAIKAALSNEFDFIQARIKADRLLALRLQDEEREQFTMEERAKFLHDIIVALRRFLAEQRAIAIRNRPPIRTQLRNQMMTYLKHVGKKKHSDLKNKTFEEIQALYEKIKEINEGAKDLEQKRLKKKVAKETPKKEDTTKVPAKVDVIEQGTKKRKGGHIKMLARKRKRPQSDVDSNEEHRKCLKIVTFKGTMDSEIMERKSVIARLNKVSSPDGDYLVIYRANGNFRAFNYLLEGDLKIMMESSTEENDQKLKDGTIIHMLVERRYPLFKDLLHRMLALGLEVERESTATLDLIRFIKKQIDEK
ncbi:hypothetical protein Tco_1081851 [Tanacetum coccineum]|uniref:Uncharacterized protein n=1 Tax=Tanacetum coccineum TaxID=301880 RepID=A0ABQ5HYS1_9ASTR